MRREALGGAPAGGLSAAAWARATRTVCSARPMRILPCRCRTTYCASVPLLATRSALILSFFWVPEFLPDMPAICRSALKTPWTVSGLAANIVRCVLLDFMATIPRSPTCEKALVRLGFRSSGALRWNLGVAFEIKIVEFRFRRHSLFHILL